MKKFLFLAILALALFAGSFAQAACTADTVDHEDNLLIIKLDCASDGSGNATHTLAIGPAYLFLMVTDPQATAPTDNYDITIIDDYGCDVLGAEGENRDTAVSEQVVPKIGNAYGSRLVHGNLDITVANAGASKEFDIYLYMITQ